MKIHIITIMVLMSAFELIGQDSLFNQTDEKLTFSEFRKIEKSYEKELNEWRKNYLNLPNKWYVALQAGYSFPFLTIKQEVPGNFNWLGISDYKEFADGTIIDEGIYSTEGRATRLAFTVGKMFNKNIGIEIGFEFARHAESLSGRIDKPNFKSSLHSTSTTLSVMPQLVFSTNNLRNFYIYGKIGPYIPFWGPTTGEVEVKDNDGSLLFGLAEELDALGTTADLVFDVLGEFLNNPNIGDITIQEIITNSGYEATFNAKINSLPNVNASVIGATAAFGFRYQASPTVSVFAEGRMGGFNVHLGGVELEELDAKIGINTLLGNISLAELTENGGTILGQEIPATALTFLLQTNYFKSLNENSNNANTTPNGVNPNLPSEDIFPRRSYLFAGFNVGVQINFGKK